MQDNTCKVTPPDSDWSLRCRTALASFAEPLARAVADKLVRTRTKQSLTDLLEKAVATLTNAPVIDRRIKEQPPASRKLLALIGLSRQLRWKVGHLLTLLSALEHSEGFTPVQTLLQAGLLFPELPADAPRLDDFAAWLGQAGTLGAVVFVHPEVAVRARGEDLGLPDLATDDTHATPRTADGLEWPLRVAAVWQQVHADAVRLTQGKTLFKRDLQRLQSDAVLSAPLTEQLAPLADPGVLALLWACAVGLIREHDDMLEAGSFPPAWEGGLLPLLTELFAALPLVEAWDPLVGYSPSDTALSPTPTAGFLCLLLARDFVHPEVIAEWLWSHHPSWAGAIPQDGAKDKGADWVRAFLLGVAYPLGLVEVSGEFLRLSAFGRHLLANESEPAAASAFPQTLLVQPNAEVLAYRQGLTPPLIAALSRFARWKGIGPACTLELTPEQTYRGLESGLTLPMIVQTLNRHSTR